MTAPLYRLVTRSDFDGLVCAVLFRELEMIGNIAFVHPKDVQDGRVQLDKNDITTNLPYSPYVHLCFDHHLSETMRSAASARQNHVINADAPSAARVVYEYYGGKERFPKVSEEMMVAVDKADAAMFSHDEVLNPENWVMLNYIMDPRTGLGRFRNFRISNYDLMMQLIEQCRHESIEEILMSPDVQERVHLYEEQKEKAMEQLRACAQTHGNVVVLDLREADPIWCTNRFMIYALFPQCNVSIHALWGVHRQNTVFAVGKSILNRSSEANIGELMLGYGGGGHKNAGTCQVDNDKAPEILQAIIGKLQD